MENNLLYLSVSAALEAGKRILEIYASESVCIHYKEDESPLTLADQEAHRIISEALCPSNLPVLSEEGEVISFEERKTWREFWLIDPLDGTKEFIKRNGEFTVNIALIQENEPVLGVVYAPVLDLLYFGQTHIGAYRLQHASELTDVNQLLHLAESLPVEVISNSFRVLISRSHVDQKTLDYINQLEQEKPFVEKISIGSSLKFCILAEGKADAYPRFGKTMEWDVAAGHAILKSMGINLVQFGNGEILKYNKEVLVNPSFLINRIV